MDARSWQSLMVDAARRHGAVIDAAPLSDPIVYTPPSDLAKNAMIKAGIVPILDHCSVEQGECLQPIAEVLRREFFYRVENETLFGSESRISPDARAIIEERRPAHSEFCKLWRTFESFRAEVQDLFPDQHNLVVAQIAKEVLTDIQGLFFPSPGPFQVPMKERIAAQKTILRDYAPSLDAERFVSTSPVNAKLAAQQSRLPPIVILIVACAVALFVPRGAWWGQVLFWGACALTVICIASLVPALLRWIMTGRLKS